MNNSLYTKILIFLAIEIILFGIIFKKPEISLFGVFTAIAMLLLFMDPKYLNNTSIIKEKIKETNFQSFLESEFFKFLKYFFLHWGFVISLITLILAFFDNFVLNFFNINLVISILFFIISLAFVHKDLMEGNIFLGNQKISSKDILFIMSGILTISLFVYIKKVPIVDKLFFSIFGGFLFYISMVYSLGYGNISMKLFKSKIIVIYLVLLISSTSLFTYNKIQLKLEEIQKNEAILVKNNENILLNNNENYLENNEEDRFITYTAPNNKLYDIHETTTGAWFLGYNTEKKYFTNIEEATKIIDISNPILSGNIEDNQETSNLSGNIKTTNETDAMIGQLINLFEEEEEIDEDLSENSIETKENELTGEILTETIENTVEIEESLNNTEENLLTGEDITYYDLIPLIINKFQLQSDNKSNVIFDNILNTDENYNYFKTAYYYKMIGRNFNSKSAVQCKTVAVFMGLAENPDTNYTSTDVFDVFWEIIDEKYNISSCCKGEDYIKKSKITCILK